MLVLSRKEGQRLIITAGGEKIEIMVCEIRGDKVRIGVQAADHVIIDREEIYQRKQGHELPERPEPR